jgi:hypothetical protein
MFHEKSYFIIYYVLIHKSNKKYVFPVFCCTGHGKELQLTNMVHLTFMSAVIPVEVKWFQCWIHCVQYEGWVVQGPTPEQQLVRVQGAELHGE